MCLLLCKQQRTIYKYTVMIIKRITVKNFGSVEFYDTVLTSKLNILDTLFTSEISTAIELVLCSKALQERPVIGVRDDTLIAAEVLVAESSYYIELKPTDEGLLKLTALDDQEKDVTDFYRTLISHCTEQDTIDNFDGRDDSFPLRLCWYRGCDDYEAPKDLHSRSNYVVSTKTFRSHLIRYIKAFEPEPINNIKNYKATINNQGRFEVVYPGVSGELLLSETEEKLFWYICFLNVAEFWTDVENIRNMHHEKKPLIIKNFLEFLDQTTDIDGLIARTTKLGRQVIILTLPMQESLKRKWMGKYDEHGKVSGT